MNIIACADKNWGIGYGGSLLFHIPGDLKRFKEMTLGKTVVMGRKTLESLPGSEPLPNRTNIVLSRDKNFKIPNVTVINSINDFLKKYDAENDGNIFVIGGEQIYKELLPYCKYAYITRVDAARPCDTYIENYDKLDNFKLIERSPVYVHNGLKYTFDTYENIILY